MMKIQCLSCESTFVKTVYKTKSKAPNGDWIYLYRCGDCGLEWEE